MVGRPGPGTPLHCIHRSVGTSRWWVPVVFLQKARESGASGDSDPSSHPTRQNIYNHPSGRILGLISPYPQTTNIQMLHPQNTTPELSDDDRSGSVARSANRRRSTRGELVFPSILDHSILIRNFLQPAINAVAQRANANDQT